VLVGTMALSGPVADSLKVYYDFETYTQADNPPGFPNGRFEGYYVDQSGGNHTSYCAAVSSANFLPHSAEGKFGSSFYDWNGGTPVSGAWNSHGAMTVAAHHTDINWEEGESFTISLWEKVLLRSTFNGWDPAGGSGRSMVFMKADFSSSATDNGLGCHLTQRNFFLAGNDSDNFGQETYKSTQHNAWDNNVWAHLVIVGTYSSNDVAGTDGVELQTYVDGQHVAALDVTVEDEYLDNTGYLTIGSFWRNNGWPHQRFMSFNTGKGWIDDFAMFDRPFTAGEAVSAYRLGSHGELQYPMSNVIQLLDVHLAGAGAVDIEPLQWSYASGLTGADGELQGTFPDLTLVVDATSGTGLKSTGKVATLTYTGGAFRESPANNGSVTGLLAVTLAGDTFAADAVSGGHVSASNVPPGLAASFTRVTDTNLTFELTGSATRHEAADGIADLGVRFADGAFSGGGAASVHGNPIAGLTVSFSDPGVLDYSRDSFEEAWGNDGTVPGELATTLANGLFSADATNHVTVTNLPAGLGAVFTRDDETRMTMVFTGRASPHGGAASITNLTVTFADGAFVSGDASAVADATRSDLHISFVDIPSYAAKLRAHWPFDEFFDVGDDGVTWNTDYFADASGNGRNAIVKREGTTFRDPTPYTNSGQFGQAFRCERGGNDNSYFYLEVAPQAGDRLNFLGYQNFTFSFWTYVNYNNTSGQRGYYFTKADVATWDMGGQSLGYAFLRKGGSGQKRHLWRVNDGGRPVEAPSQGLQTLEIPENTALADRWDNRAWTHWTVTRVATSGIVRVYVNGDEKAMAVQNTREPDDWVTTEPFRMCYRHGQHQRSYAWPCLNFGDAFIDDFAVLGQAMTAAEAKAVHDLGANAELNYDIGKAVTLLDLHLAGSGSIVIDGATWSYSTGLVGPGGELTGEGGVFTLVLNESVQTGVITGTPGMVLLVR